MDTELSALAGTAAATLTGLLTTDAWERFKCGMGDLWRRAHPERADTVEAEIIEARGELLASGSDDEQLHRRLTDEWASRIYRLLLSDPTLAAPLRELLRDGSAVGRPADGPRIGKLEQHVRVSGHGRAYVVGQGEQRNGPG